MLRSQTARAYPYPHHSFIQSSSHPHAFILLLDAFLTYSQQSQTLSDIHAPMNVLVPPKGRRVSGISAVATPKKLAQENEQLLNFYTEAPSVELSIDDFEIFALKRLKVRWINDWRSDNRDNHDNQATLSRHLLPVWYHHI